MVIKVFLLLSQWTPEAGANYSMHQNELGLLNVFGYVNLARCTTRLREIFSSLGYDIIMWVDFKIKWMHWVYNSF